MKGTVYFIGAGPGDPELLTVKGRQIVDSADVIVYAGSLVNPLLLEGARSDAAVHDSAVLDLQQITGIMIDAASRGKTVAPRVKYCTITAPQPNSNKNTRSYGACWGGMYS